LRERISDLIDEKKDLLDFLNKESYEKINLTELEYIPKTEGTVIFLTGLLVAKGELPLRIKKIRSGYPDMEATYYTKDGWKTVTVEFEVKSSDFLIHKHDPNECDMIICWEHNWTECPEHIEVIELKKFIPKKDI